MTPPSLDVGACNEKLLLLADLVADLERQGEPTSSDLVGDRDVGMSSSGYSPNSLTSPRA